MKHFVMNIFLLSTLFIAACNNSGTTKEASSSHDMNNMKDSSSASAEKLPDNLATVTPSFSDVDAKVSTTFQEVLQHYYHIQFALAGDDGPEAANGGKAMAEAMTKVDKSAMAPEQKALYEKNEEDLREHAEHIAKSKIDHQREHFEKMSEDIYELVKGFGAGKPVYKTFCPMAFDNKGAYWISTSTEVKNPYFGKGMLTCGEVQEVIK